MSYSTDSVPFQDLLQRQKDLAREQLAAAWQIHVEQVEEQLHKGWKENLSSLFEERFRLLSEGMEEEFQKRLSVKQAEVRAQALGEAERVRKQARLQAASDLNQSVRRLAQAEDAGKWVAVLLDSLQGGAEQAAFFFVASGKLRCEASWPKPASVEIELANAPAFLNVQQTMDTVVVGVSPAEMNERIYEALELRGREKAYLLPVTSGAERQLIGIVLAVPAKESFDLAATELLCSVAGPLRRLPAPKAGVVLTGIATAAAPGATAAPRANLELEQRAQRFARVKVAEMRLFHSQAVLDGRSKKDLYGELKNEIDKARAQYKEEFGKAPECTDHLHAELIRTLANGDVTLMGAGYAGELS